MDSIQEQIMKKIEAAMAGIAGVQSAQRFRASGIDLARMPTILVKEGDCAPELERSSYPHLRRRMEVFLVICVAHDETVDLRSGGEIMNGWIAEIEAVLVARQRWDGLALMTDPPTYLEMLVEAETPHLARGLRFEIVYEHERANPWAQ